MHHATMLHEGIPGSRLVVVDGAAHTLIWTHTAEFVRLVEEFLGIERERRADDIQRQGAR